MIEIEHWKLEWGELNEENLCSRLTSEGYTVNKYHYPPGTYFPEHKHSVDKKDAVLKGQFLIRANGQEYLLGPGDILSIPTGLAHSAEVIGNGTVISIDAAKY